MGFTVYGESCYDACELRDGYKYTWCHKFKSSQIGNSIIIIPINSIITFLPYEFQGHGLMLIFVVLTAKLQIMVTNAWTNVPKGAKITFGVTKKPHFGVIAHQSI